MQFSQGNNPVRSKLTNNISILRTIYYNGPIKRAEIATLLGLTLPTITTSVNTMIADGIVRTVEQESLPSPALGRKAYLVDLVPNARHFAGVEINREYRAVCVTDYRGQVLARSLDEAACADYEENIQAACALMMQALENAGLSLEKIDGVGFCLPGIVDQNTGTLKMEHRLNWMNKDLRKDIAQLTGYTGPIEVENNVCARATGVQLFCRDLVNDVRTFAYLYIAAGIACPLILNTSDFSGSLVGVGEIGRMVMNPDSPVHTCGQPGSLTSFSSDTAILKLCQSAMDNNNARILQTLLPADGHFSMKEVLLAQELGDPDVHTIIHQALKMLGIAVANIINFSNPQMMLIEGKLFSNQANQDTFRGIISNNLYSSIHMDTKYVFIEAEPFSGATGAAAVSICRDLERYAVQL